MRFRGFWPILTASVLLARLAAQQATLLTPEQFFRLAGAGLRTIEEERSSYWQPHLDNSHRRILEAAAACARRSTVLILGAGNCIEIPLEELARNFDEVILVDLDGESMAAAVEDLPEELIEKVHIRVDDVTDFAAPLMRRLRQSAVASESAEQVFERFSENLSNLKAQDSPFQLPAADLVVSSLVLSELPRYPLNYAARLVRDKFATRLTAWQGHEQFRARLQQIALQDHIGLLARSCRRGGAVYFADTIARGPVYEKISQARRHEVLQAMAPELARLGLFQSLREQGEPRDTFSASFPKIRARWDGGEQPPAEKTMALIGQLSTEPRTLAEADRGAAAETVVNLLCNERFDVAAETEALERLAELYANGPESFEPLVPLESLENTWAERDLAPQGKAESWPWLEYPCSIAYSTGAFQVRSWVLKHKNEK